MDDFLKLSDDWGELQNGGSIVPYGIGRIGRRVIPTLLKECKVPVLVDKKKDAEEVFGLRVCDLREAAPLIKERNLKIVVTTVRSSYDEISKELTLCGFREYQDFCMFERFAEEWNLRWRNKCVLSKIDTVITSRCTLKCRNCNLFIGYANQHADMELCELQRNFDTFFGSVDFVYEYTLLGGEPFLHAELEQIFSYLMEKYGDRIGKVNLISNGTVVPCDTVLELMKKYEMSVHISDYTQTVKYEKKLVEVIEAFSKKGIEYYVIPNNTWKDVKYPGEEFTAEKPREHMLLCGHSTHSVGNGKLYWCDPAFAAECFTGFKAMEDDSLDLIKNRENNSKHQATLNILKYMLGDVNERGYMSICEKCAGVGKDNSVIVTAGLQMNS